MLIGWSVAASDVIMSYCRCKSAAARKRFLRLATLSLTVALSSSTMELLIRGEDSGKGADLQNLGDLLESIYRPQYWCSRLRAVFF